MSNKILKKIAEEMDMPEDATPMDTLEAVSQMRSLFIQTRFRELRNTDELISIMNIISEHRYYRGFSISVEEVRILKTIEEKIQKLLT